MPNPIARERAFFGEERASDIPFPVWERWSLIPFRFTGSGSKFRFKGVILT